MSHSQIEKYFAEACKFLICMMSRIRGMWTLALFCTIWHCRALLGIRTCTLSYILSYWSCIEFQNSWEMLATYSNFDVTFYKVMNCVQALREHSLPRSLSFPSRVLCVCPFFVSLQCVAFSIIVPTNGSLFWKLKSEAAMKTKRWSFPELRSPKQF